MLKNKNPQDYCNEVKVVYIIPYNTKLSWQETFAAHSKLLFRHKTFAVTHDVLKDYAYEGDH